MNILTIIVYVTSIPLSVLFACYAVYSHFHKQQDEVINNIENQDELDEFIAAKKSQTFWRVNKLLFYFYFDRFKIKVMYSFMSSSLGAWVLFGKTNVKIILK